MRVLICGGRYFDDRNFIWNTLCDLHRKRGPITCVVHGAASGADTEGMIWAQAMPSVLHAPFQAEWDKYGKAAGPIRNQRMIDEGKPDLVVAFPGGKGTADMVARSRNAGIEIIEVQP